MAVAAVVPVPSATALCSRAAEAAGWASFMDGDGVPVVAVAASVGGGDGGACGGGGGGGDGGGGDACAHRSAAPFVA